MYNKERKNASNRAWRSRNRDAWLAGKIRYHIENRDMMCQRMRNRNSQHREVVLRHYSSGNMKCSKCDCNDVDMLVLDHIEGGGKAHKRSVGGPGNLCFNLIQEGFPPVVQVLCANHNQKKDIERRREVVSTHICNVYRKKRNNIKRLACLMQYSEGLLKCASCDVDDVDVLLLDHINNDGAQHRQDIGGGGNIYVALVREGFPPGIQVLCANHNHKKEMERRRNGVRAER